MKVKEIMTADSLKSCTPETKLSNAARIMKTANCGALPVIDKQKNVVGIITDRDICLSLVKKQTKVPLTVGKIMAKKIQTIKDEDDVTEAYREMRLNQIGRLPVVDEKGKLKGIVSLHNLINNAISDGKVELGDLSSSDENLLKTIRAITNRYNGIQKKQKGLSKQMSKAELLYEEA